MKNKQPKPARLRAKEAADKEAEKLRTCIAGLRKVGKAPRFTFVCKVKRALDCDFETAEGHFENAVSRGEIRKVGQNGARDVWFFEA